MQKVRQSHLAAPRASARNLPTTVISLVALHLAYYLAKSAAVNAGCNHKGGAEVRAEAQCSDWFRKERTPYSCKRVLELIAANAVAQDGSLYVAGMLGGCGRERLERGGNQCALRIPVFGGRALVDERQAWLTRACRFLRLPGGNEGTRDFGQCSTPCREDAPDHQKLRTALNLLLSRFTSGC